MDAKLLVVDGRATRQIVKIHLPVTVGRAEDQWLRIDHKTVSRRHCELFERDGRIIVRDVGSANGTLVDDSPVQEAILEPGHRLTIGPLVFEARYKLGNGFVAAPPISKATPSVGVAADPTAQAVVDEEPPVTVEVPPSAEVGLDDLDLADIDAGELEFEPFTADEAPAAPAAPEQLVDASEIDEFLIDAPLAEAPLAATPLESSAPLAPAGDEIDFDAPTPFNPNAEELARSLSEEVRDFSGPVVDEPSQEIFFADPDDLVEEPPADAEAIAAEDFGDLELADNSELVAGEASAAESAALSSPADEPLPVDDELAPLDDELMFDVAEASDAPGELLDWDAPQEESSAAFPQPAAEADIDEFLNQPTTDAPIEMIDLELDAPDSVDEFAPTVAAEPTAPVEDAKTPVDDDWMPLDVAEDELHDAGGLHDEDELHDAGGLHDEDEPRDEDDFSFAIEDAQTLADATAPPAAIESGEPEAALSSEIEPLDSLVLDFEDAGAIDDMATTSAAPAELDFSAEVLPAEAATDGDAVEDEVVEVEEILPVDDVLPIDDEVLSFDEGAEVEAVQEIDEVKEVDEVIAFDDELAVDEPPLDLEARTEPWAPLADAGAPEDVEELATFEEIESSEAIVDSFDDEPAGDDLDESLTEPMNSKTVSDDAALAFLEDALGPDFADTAEDEVVAFDDLGPEGEANESPTVPWHPPGADTVPDWANQAQSAIDKAGGPPIDPADDNALDFHDVSFDLSMTSTPSEVEGVAQVDDAMAAPAPSSKGKKDKPAKADKPKRSWWPFGRKKAAAGDAPAKKADKKSRKAGAAAAASEAPVEEVESLEVSFDESLAEAGSPFAAGHVLEPSEEAATVPSEIEFFSEDEPHDLPAEAAASEVVADDDFAFEEGAVTLESSLPADAVEPSAEEVAFEMLDEPAPDAITLPSHEQTIASDPLPAIDDGLDDLGLPEPAAPAPVGEVAGFDVDELAFEEPDGMTEMLAREGAAPAEESASEMESVELDFTDDVSMPGSESSQAFAAPPAAAEPAAAPPAKAKRSWWPFGGKKSSAPKPPKAAKPAKPAKEKKSKKGAKAAAAAPPPAPADQSESAMDFTMDAPEIETESRPAAPAAADDASFDESFFFEDDAAANSEHDDSGLEDLFGDQK